MTATGSITARTAEILLDYLGTLGGYVGLAHALPQDGVQPTLATITEVTTPGYARGAVAWAPSTVVDTPYFSGRVSLSNQSAFTIGPVTADMPNAPYAFLTTANTGNVIDVPVATIGSPASGGSFAAGQYSWRVTAVNGRGETKTSNEVSATLSANQKVTVSWAAITGATKYRVYRKLTSATQWNLVSTISAPTTSYMDTGVDTGDLASLPTLNTAAVADLLYVWELQEPVRAQAGKPIYCPAGRLIIQ